jgi:hypothetical protein
VKVLSALSLVAAMVFIVAIIMSARAGDVAWVLVWAAGLGILGLGCGIEIFIKERTR